MNAEERAREIVQAAYNDYHGDAPQVWRGLLVDTFVRHIAAALQEAEPVPSASNASDAGAYLTTLREMVRWVDSEPVQRTFNGYATLTVTHRHLAAPVDPAFAEWARGVWLRAKDLVRAQSEQAPAPEAQPRPTEGVTRLVAEWRERLGPSSGERWKRDGLLLRVDGQCGKAHHDGCAFLSCPGELHGVEQSKIDLDLIVWMRNHAEEIIAALDAAHRGSTPIGAPQIAETLRGVPLIDLCGNCRRPRRSDKHGRPDYEAMAEAVRALYASRESSG